MFPKSSYYIDSDAVQLQASNLWEEKKRESPCAILYMINIYIFFFLQ